MKNDGGPAFPAALESTRIGFQVFQGMTLRDYFAAAAMAGGCVYAKDAFVIADKMLEERKVCKDISE